MRLFIAIELPRKTRDALAALQSELKESGADVKWVAPENIHLTLKFIGETNEADLKNILRAMEETAKGHCAFTMRAASCGAFPNINSPRVIWVGLSKGSEETKQIAEGLEVKLAAVGIPKEERPFSSHITLGRTRSSLNRDKLVDSLKILEEKLPEEEFMVTKITLFKSTLTPKGAVYEALQEASLKTT